MWAAVRGTLRRIVLYRVRLTVNKMAGQLPPIVSSVYMGNVLYSAESSDKEKNSQSNCLILVTWFDVI